MSRKLPYFVVNAFADKPFTGNAAAVCWVKNKPLSNSLMQSIASEINLSETCFIFDENGLFKQNKSFGLRWFTPTNEVPLCGHATLASAATLFYKASNFNSQISFETLSGTLYARKNQDYITLDFPRNAPQPLDSTESEKCQKVLEELFAGTVHLENVREVQISRTAKKLLVRMKEEKFKRTDLESLSPEISRVHSAHDGSLFKGVIVTTSGSEKYDFVSRYFAPWNGIPEDPVTGSAHTVLGPYWSGVMDGKLELSAHQCSSRGGDLMIKLRHHDDRVDLSGFATVVVEGELTVPQE